MPRLRSFLLLLAIPAFGLTAFAQQAPPPKPQTARQALIEIVTKGGEALQKHLTVEVQDILNLRAKSGGSLAMLNAMKPESGLETFESGEVLFAYNDSAQHTKYEVHVDNDDLAGDEDSLLLSIHSFRDGKEQDDQWNLMSTHFTVSMKLQQNVWRLDKISVGAEFPVGDPNFVEKAFLKGEAAGMAVMPGLHASTRVDSGPAEPPSVALPPQQFVRLLGFAESTFAQQHPEVGFTCSLSELSESSRAMGVDQQVINGAYNGYRFALAGCEGKPAGSFQIIAEPMVAKPAAKAFCTDATHNLRESQDGQGATCLASGKPAIEQADEGAIVGLSVSSSEAAPRK